jgi:hypothetical protein
MSEFELPKGRGWEAVDRWLKESEATSPIPRLLQNALARWGTRGFVAGLCGGVFALIVGQRITGDSALDGKHFWLIRWLQRWSPFPARWSVCLSDS